MMRIIYNKIIPFKGFKAVNLFGFLFARKKLSEDEIRHEEIHSLQMKEMLYVGFYIWYCVEWLIRFFLCWNAKRAYFNISFEREAYLFQGSPSYLEERKHYSWFHYLKQKI